jgi:hypothetical protein
MFPVELHPVFASVHTVSGDRRISVPDKRAIVNQESQRVLGIVSRDYVLVTNQQALEWAYQCCITVFPETSSGEWEVMVVDAPSTGGHCYIDLVHNSAGLDFSFVQAGERPDAYGPFIRVTNSYNGLRALGFEIGFYRKICKNGMILREIIIQFKYVHLRRDLGETIRFEVADERLTKAKKSFGEYLGALHSCHVAREYFEPLIKGVLVISSPASLKPNTRESEDWKALQVHIREMSNRYASEVGENAYAVFNAITEFASHPPTNRCLHRDRHSLQQLAGAWLNTFSQQCRQSNFIIAEYVSELTKDLEKRVQPTA